MAQQWHPDIQRRILPGPTAHAWGLVGAVLIAVCFASFGILIVGVGLSTVGITPNDLPYLYVALVVFLMSVLLIGRGSFSPMFWAVERRQKQERAEGYTTRLNAVYEDDVAVDVVDWRSGRVIRMAHEPLVESKYLVDKQAQIQDRIRLVRAEARAARAGLLRGPEGPS
ncbi:hypothetical protein GCM10010413_10030 [Promicromonospora sukumoe]|uniref:Uncharacterized protein n=1 Tax=Promicromonospora sukumoe TaxID=88382 RepID=A0A7W3J5H8_9MICO|nr:hypothetical protein [Promicromonospora sukumoe]MBA8806671.1 hypothetical protein [Promicromonospora sukumoe]